MLDKDLNTFARESMIEKNSFIALSPDAQGSAAETGLQKLS